ncbi:MAG: DUF4097 domain-containing protein [Acidobacteriia bacterium]|nr:DUF4097 domain-containing protein [Terriglobia bacterium]
MKLIRTISLSLLIVTVAALPLLAAETGTFERTLKVTGQVSLDLRSGTGNVKVHAGPGDSVHVSATIRAGDSWFGMSAREKVTKLQSNPPVVQAGNLITIGKIEDSALRNDVSIDYDVTVPAQTQLTSRTGTGAQTISGLNLAMKVSSGTGEVAIDHAGAGVHVSTGTGNVHLTTIKGVVEASTGTGQIQATGVGGDLKIHTGTGTITVEDSSSGTIEASTGTGTVRLRGVKGALKIHTGSGEISVEGEPRANWELAAGNGGIGLKLPSAASFNLDARSQHGTVTVNRKTVEGSVARNRVQGKVGSGGPLVDAQTGSGHIQVD